MLVFCAGDFVDGGAFTAVVGAHAHQIQATSVEGFIRAGEGAVGVDHQAVTVRERERALTEQPGAGNTAIVRKTTSLTSVTFAL